MNPTLRYAQKELSKIKRIEENNQMDMLTITIDFGRHEDSPKPYGYPTFLEVLESLGDEHKEEYIQEACRISGLSRGSVRFDDKEDFEPIIIKTPIPRGLL